MALQTTQRPSCLLMFPCLQYIRSRAVFISRAMWTGDRCGMNCGSSTTSPATVYFPQGFVRFLRETERIIHLPDHRTYLVSDTIPALYYTEIVGDARRPPTILAAANFNPTALAIFGEETLACRFPTARDICFQMLTHTSLAGEAPNIMSTKTTCEFASWMICYRLNWPITQLPGYQEPGYRHYSSPS